VKTKQLTQFRDEVYQNFNNYKRTDMLMGLVDALSSNTTARTAVELTLNPHFRRHYTALNKAVVVDALPDQELAGLACQTIGAPIKREFRLLATDVTSAPRPFADTLFDRGLSTNPTPSQATSQLSSDINTRFGHGCQNTLNQRREIG